MAIEVTDWRNPDGIGAFLTGTFPNYTKEMYGLNQPSRIEKGRTVSGKDLEVWSGAYGGAETVDGEILTCSFNLNKEISVKILGDKLCITRIPYNGKPDIWEYSTSPDFKFPVGMPCLAEEHYHLMEDEMVDEVLNTVVPDCRLWLIVQKRAKELRAKHQQN